MWTVYEMACFLFHVQWTSSCDHAVTSSAVLYRVSLTSGWCLRFSSSTEFFLVVNRDRYPQFALFLAWVSGCCSTLTRWSMYLGMGCSMEACDFLRVARAVRLESGPYFLSPLFLAATCPCALRQSTLLLEEFHIFSSCWLSRLPCAVRT